MSYKQLLDGMDLQHMVARFGPLAPGRVIWLLRQACRSLSEAHDNGLVHRDIKPANLFATRLGGEFDFLKVLDFGMVRAEEGEHALQLTTDGSLVGTPAFVAPECAMGEEPVDGRADLYSLGCTAFWLLTGVPVFRAKTPTKMLIEHVRSSPPPVSKLSEQEIPAALEDLILQCLEKDPKDRPMSAADLWQRLGAVECASAWNEDRARHWWQVHVRQGRPG